MRRDAALSDDAATLEIRGLELLTKALKAKPPRTRVGIIGAKAGPHYAVLEAGDEQPEHIPTNAEVGAKHEFGTHDMPVRSFLRMPITDRLEKEMEASGALDVATFQQVLKEKSILPWMKKIAVLAEGIVADAFDTGGFGKWPPSNMAFKKVKQTLVETTQLRNSITSEVKG
jgi:hypothetical protein